MSTAAGSRGLTVAAATWSCLTRKTLRLVTAWPLFSALVLISALCTALFVTILHAAVVARLVLQPLADRPGQHVLVATIGLAIALQEYMRLSQGTGTRWVSPVFNTPFVLAHAPRFLVTVTPVALAAAIIAFTAAAGLLLMMRYSRFGRQWLAVADDPLAAALFGVSSLTVYAQTFALACGMAGLTGVIITLYYGGIGFAGPLAAPLAHLAVLPPRAPIRRASARDWP